ncbi:Insecticidal toxin complex protein [Cellulophaga lytica]|uniref:Insecticidal toxin complex protein n=1 Tax=Cellulophaga lytica TaxID=979 RepID=UPI0026E22AAB|nr:Insecticidal toxin complex protein [Cellulophaga lytica]MDO6854362.1 Insecticidal toxin complex protein [Cellulophaga lytica]
MRYLVTLILFFFCVDSSAAEWKNFKAYQQKTGRNTLLPKDWLKKDRLKNTVTWQQANSFNLKNNSFLEYQTIKQRRDFYKWYALSIEKKGHKVVWPRMAHFISAKLNLATHYPYKMFLKNDVIDAAKIGSEKVFNSAFLSMYNLYSNTTVLNEKESLAWDKAILYKEQHIWVKEVYDTLNEKTLKRLAHIAKGKFVYAVVVPKKLRFKGCLASAQERYTYAMQTLRKHCENSYW